MWLQSTRNYAKAIFAVAALGMAGACADQTSAPTAEIRPFYVPANFTEVGEAETFSVSNSTGITKRVGAHLINIPAGAICALDSDYSAAAWDQTCEPLVGSVDITASVFAGPDGEPYVDFQPAMRFAPDKEVMLFLIEGRSDGTKRTAVKYCNNIGYCVDESLTDASLRPFRVGTTATIGRRIKHFSGYVVAYEGDCPGTVTDNGDGTYWCDDGGLTRRSGYMVASGKDVTEVLKEEKDGKKPDEM
jgi:hypothetical protein